MPAPKHVYVTYIRTTPDRLWQALTDPDFTQRYFFGSRVASDWTPGAQHAWTLPDGYEPVRGEVLEAEPFRRLAYSWDYALDEGERERPSRVTYEIEPVGAACKLTVVHDDFHGITKTFGIVGRGWPRVIAGLKSLLETGEPLAIDETPAAEPDALDVDAEENRDWGRRSNGRCWELLAREARSEAEDGEMVEVAYASAWHWRGVGTVVNEQRAEWMLSHVHAVLGHAAETMRHAQRCLAITEAEGLDGFDRAYAFEALYRAHAIAGDAAAADKWYERAVAAGSEIPDAEDREIYLGDLAVPVPA
jgi:uncharacterized protein YndB with AHSA1/START domain